MNFIQVFAYCINAFHIINAEPFRLYQIIDHSFQNMAHGQKTQPPVFFFNIQQRTGSHDIAHKIIMGQHNPFGPTGGSGCVNNGKEVIFGNAVFYLGKFVFIFFPVLFAEFQNFAPVGNPFNFIVCIYFFDFRYFIRDRFYLVIVFFRRYNGNSCFGMLQYIAVLSGANVRINRDMNNTNLSHAHIGKIPFGTVVGNRKNFVSFFKAHCHQAIAEIVNKLFVFVGTKTFPTAIPFDRKSYFVIVFFDILIKDVKISFQFHDNNFRLNSE